MNKVHISQGDYIPLFDRTDNDALGISAVDVGEVISVSGYTHICGYVFSDVASAIPNGIIIEQGGSSDDFPSGTVATSDITRSVTTIAANELIDNSIAVQIVAPFARIIYTNGAVAQTQYRAFFSARLIRGL